MRRLRFSKLHAQHPGRKWLAAGGLALLAALLATGIRHVPGVRVAGDLLDNALYDTFYEAGAYLETHAKHTVLNYTRGTEKDADELISRFRHSPKPMYYQPAFLTRKWAEFKKLNKITDDSKVDPGKFGAWGFEALLHDRLPRYQKLADNFGYTIDAADLATVRDGEEFIDLVASAIKGRMR